MNMRIELPSEHGAGIGAVDATVFSLLSSTRRRHTLYELLNHDSPLSPHHLALTIAAWESHQPLSAVDDDLYQQILTALHHTHLPKLADADLVSYDEQQERVAFTPSGTRFETILGEIANLEFA